MNKLYNGCPNYVPLHYIMAGQIGKPFASMSDLVEHL